MDILLIMTAAGANVNTLNYNQKTPLDVVKKNAVGVPYIERRVDRRRRGWRTEVNYKTTPKICLTVSNTVVLVVNFSLSSYVPGEGAG